MRKDVSMTRPTVWIVSPPGYMHSSAFEHIADALGYDVVTDGRKCHGKTIILGGHLLRPYDYLPDNFIIYNLEQAGSAWMDGYYLQLMRQANEVWDYSETNIAWLLESGIMARYCEVGYAKCMERIAVQEPEIDVLFYGSMNPRRENILNQLRDAGSVVHHAFNVYVEDMDALIAKSRVVLNIAYYPAKIFNIVRCSYLFANKICVVSEIGVEDEPYRDTGGFTTYDRLAEYAMAFARNDKLRKQVAERGYEIISKHPQVNLLA